MNNNLGEGNLHAIFVKSYFELAVHLALGWENITLIYQGQNTEYNSGISQSLYACILEAVGEKIAALQSQLIHGLLEHLFNMGNVGGISCTDVADCIGLVAAAVLDAADIGVVDDLKVEAVVLNYCGAHADALYGAAEIIQPNNIANIYGTLEYDKDTGENVLTQTLCAKGENQGHNADAGQGDAHINAKDGENPHDGPDSGYPLDKTLEDG